MSQLDSSHLEHEEHHQTNQNQSHLLAIVPSQFISSSSPFATISLSLPKVLPTHFINRPKITSLRSYSPSIAKIPTEACALSLLSLSSQTLYHPVLSSRPTIFANPLQETLCISPRRPSDPSGGAAIRRASIVWFRNDLRVRDNECLNSANNESMSVLPVYCFDPREYGKSCSGFDKTGPYRASFLIESVADLRKNLQAKGSDLVVRVGKPESVLVELAKAIGAYAVYAHREASHCEVQTEDKIEATLKDEGIEVRYFWGSTLYHVDDLPFTLEDTPSNYSGFREKIQGLDVRKTIAALDQLKGVPSKGDVEPGEIPSLLDLGVNSTQNGQPVAIPSMVGGENEALRRLKNFAAECQAQPPKGGSQDSIYGANLFCKISPWLTTGCLSPRSMFDELKKASTRTTSAALEGSDGGCSLDTGMNWLMFELLWRDFFRFITMKYSRPKKQQAIPATASAGALD